MTESYRIGAKCPQCHTQIWYEDSTPNCQCEACWNCGQEYPKWEGYCENCNCARWRTDHEESMVRGNQEESRDPEEPEIGEVCLEHFGIYHSRIAGRKNY